jgi:hypothetical protein
MPSRSRLGRFIDAVTLAQGVIAAVLLAAARATAADAIGVVFAFPLLYVAVVRILRSLHFALTGRESRLNTIGRSTLPPATLGQPWSPGRRAARLTPTTPYPVVTFRTVSARSADMSSSRPALVPDRDLV